MEILHFANIMVVVCFPEIEEKMTLMKNDRAKKHIEKCKVSENGNHQTKAAYNRFSACP